jgi:hypothetical protein
VAASITDLSFPSFMCPSFAPDITTSVGSAVARAVAASHAGQAFETQGLPLQAAAEFDATVAALSLMLAVAPPQVHYFFVLYAGVVRNRFDSQRGLG